MKRTAGGFTLIELIVVIVILGILAATAMPKFIDMRTEAADAAVAGVAGGLTSASAINYAGKMAGKTVTPGALSGANTDVCTSGLGNMLTGGLPAGYAIAVSATATCASGALMVCDVALTSGSTTAHADANITCY